MTAHNTGETTVRTPVALRLGTLAIAVAIFVADTVTDLEIAVAVFYVVVVLISVRFARRREVILTSATCMALTVTSAILTQTGDFESGLANSIISVAAIAITTFLVLTIEAARAAAQEARAQLAHVSRITTLGELTTSIAHEVNQPLGAIVTSGNAGVRWLNADPPNVEKARRAVERMVADANRASEIVARVRRLAKRQAPKRELLSINDPIREVLALVHRDLDLSRISLRTRLGDDLPPVLADRIELQQVVLNLIMNGIEAINLAVVPPRELEVTSASERSLGLVVTIQDTGQGLAAGDVEGLFDPFRTTKAGGLGMGLAISRAIVEAHRGRIWASRNHPRGAIFQFALPIETPGKNGSPA